MTYITRVEFHNWARYAGRVAIDLGPEIYAVEARWHDDDDRSNWGGKSRFVGGIRFALFGAHDDQGSGAGSEDAWITRGKDEGGVKLILSTGHAIERSRKRGSSTKITCLRPGASTPAIGDAAQAEIEQLVGVGKKDFDSTMFVRQKEIAAFVTGDAGDRQELILDWCQLRPLQRAAKRASDQLSNRIAMREKAEARAVALAEMLARYLPGTYGGRTVTTIEGLASAVASLRELQSESLGTLDVLRRRREQGIAWDAKASALASQTALGQEVEEALVLAVKLRAAVPTSPDLAPFFSAHQAAAADLRTKKQLAAGKFDGQCPVGNCPCPITNDLNAARETNAAAFKEAEANERFRKGLLEAGQREASATRDAERAAERAESRLRALEEQAARLQAVQLHGGRPEAVDAAAMANAERAVNDARTNLTRAEDAQRQVLAVSRDIEDAKRTSADLAIEVGELRGASVALGRSGAQRVIGQRMVSKIERSANLELASAGIGLVVRVPWEREGGKLAPECEACGTPIKGEAIKECPRCGAHRPKATVLGPFVTMSDRSGAADDLVGLTLQLAAAGWLRRKRLIAWSSVVLDEPFGALDKTHRQGVAAHLLAMLRGRHGFEQAFVISHERGTLDAMPARIIVRAGVAGSTLEVLR